MMILQDNTKISSTANSLDDFLKLQNIANRKISEVVADDGNRFLIYPQSFFECDDKSGNQNILSLQPKLDGNKCIGATLETGNIAGFIGINDLSVSIHSRFAKEGQEDFFLHYMLQKVLCINIVNLMHGTAKDSIFDLLIYLFPKFLNEALAQGLYKEYQRKDYNDANVRGPINVARHLKLNIPFNGHIAYTTREFCYDNNITELIRHTIEYLRQNPLGKALLSDDLVTSQNVKQIELATPQYQRLKRDKVIKSNLKPINHPYFSRYTALQILCLRILRHEQLKYGSKEEMVYGVLFDVSYLWEEYLATILKKHRFSHPRNRSKFGYKYLVEPSRFRRYPDYYREDDKIIIDAKYKREIDSVDDINQMITYMYRLKGNKGIFIQPNKEKEKKDSYNLLGYGKDINAKLHIYQFPIPQEADNYKGFVEEIIKSENKLESEISNNFG